MNKLRSSSATVILLQYVTLFTSATRHTPTVFLKFTSVTRHITTVSDISNKCISVGYNRKWLKDSFALDRF